MWAANGFAVFEVLREANFSTRCSPSPQPSPPSGRGSRRQFLKIAGKGMTLSALFAGLPRGWAGGVSADDSPEVSHLRFGIIALTYTSLIVIVHVIGFIK